MPRLFFLVFREGALVPRPCLQRKRNAVVCGRSRVYRTFTRTLPHAYGLMDELDAADGLRLPRETSAALAGGALDATAGARDRARRPAPPCGGFPRRWAIVPGRAPDSASGLGSAPAPQPFPWAWTGSSATFPLRAARNAQDTRQPFPWAWTGSSAS